MSHAHVNSIWIESEAKSDMDLGVALIFDYPVENEVGAFVWSFVNHSHHKPRRIAWFICQVICARFTQEDLATIDMVGKNTLTPGDSP